MQTSLALLSRFSAGHRRFGTIFLMAMLVLQTPAPAQTPNKIQKLVKSKSFKKGTAADSVIAGNKVYEIALENNLGNGIGLFTLRTGRNHPITENFGGQKQNLLGGGSTAELGSSYITVRSYSSGTDYSQSEFTEKAPGFRIAWLDSLLLVTNNFNPTRPIINPAGDTTGYEVIYDFPGKPKTPDQMRLTTRIQTNGRSFSDSWVEMTTIIENTGSGALEIGIRYLLDLKVGGDDGPVVSETVFGTSFGRTEAHFDWVNFAYFLVEANDALPPNRGSPGYHVYGSGITPTNLLRAAFQPAVLQHVSWPLAFLKPFTYEVNPDFVVTRDAPNTAPNDSTGGDNAILYFWGETRDKSIVIQSGQKIQVTQAILASPPDDRPPLYDREPPACDLAAVNLGPPKSFEFVVQDPISGLRQLRPINVFNATVEIPTFRTGVVEPIKVVGTVIDETKPFGFTLRALDLCGNEIFCDPIFLTLLPELRVFEQRFELIPSDRYFYIKNQGIRRLAANLNGHEFILSAEPNGAYKANNLLFMPLHGEMTIDMFRYLKPDNNTMSIAFDGPDGSRADLVISDMKMKSSIDAVLDLAPIPQTFGLSQNLPNPFLGVTTIRFDVPELVNAAGGAKRVELKIYNVLGQLVRTLVDAELPPGSYTANWNGRHLNGRPAAAGVYFYNLNAGGTRITKKMALIQ